MKDDLPKMAFDKIPEEKKNAKKITKLIKDKNKVVGYEIAGEFDVSKEKAIQMAEAGEIKNVGIAHKKSTKYLKSLPDGNDNNNLSSLPSKSNKVRE